MTTQKEPYKTIDFNKVNVDSFKLPHRTIDENAYHMGYPCGNLSGLNWGVYDHYGMHAREQKKGTHLVDRNRKY